MLLEYNHSSIHGLRWAIVFDMGTATSKSLAAVTLTLLPFDALTLSLRFYVRISRRAWGLDDWAMLIATVGGIQAAPSITLAIIDAYNSLFSSSLQYL